VLREQGHVVGGLDVLLDGRVPVGAGLSSSAALECSVAVAAAELFGLLLSDGDLARVAQRAENDFVGVPCGLMDQMASMASTAGHALLFDVRSGLVEQVPFAPQDAGLTVAVIDTHVKHSVGEGAYADRRSTCEQAAQALGLSSLRDVDPGDLDAVLARVSPEAAPRVRHVVTEIERVGDAVAALRRGDWAGLGRAMTASHESLREDYEVSSDELDAAVAASLAAGALGARMTGAGFGGSAIALVARARLGRLTADVTRAFADKGFPEPSVIEAVAREGARRVW
jgi:galactokinase